MSYYNLKEAPTEGEIASTLRTLGTIEGHDTLLHHGGRTYALLDDGTVMCGTRLVSHPNKWAGRGKPAKAAP
jgi:hypothetical protein